MQTILVPNFTKRGGLITVVTQDYNTGNILMVAFASKKAFMLTLKTGEAHYFSTSRRKIWKKGEESGNIQKVRSIRIDCDGDAIIYRVIQQGQGACHTGKYTCFWRSVIGSSLDSEHGSLKTMLIEISNSIGI